MWNILSNIVNTIINPVPLFEWLVISDSLCSSINFIKNYIFSLSPYNNVGKIKNKNEIIKRKQILIKKYNTLYKIELVDRYIFYLFLYITYLILISGIELWTKNIYIKYILYINYTVLTLPYIQNKLLETDYINNIVTEFRNDKIRFMKYTISKITIKCIKCLDISIIGIKNYHIFILYNYISFTFLLEFIKCYSLIYLLYFLRNSTTTYYYYKAIKIAYYYNTNYLFNILTHEEAINNINNIIKEKKWKEITNINNVHSLYILFQYKFNQSDNKYDMYINIIGFFTLWSLICILKVINYTVGIIILSLYITINIYNNSAFIKNNYKKIFTSYFVYIMIFLGINDLLITLVCINYKILYYVWNEIYFYIENKKDIKKVLDFYKLKE